MKKTIKKILSIYSDSFKQMRNDLPQIILFLKCILGLAMIGLGYVFGGKTGLAANALISCSLNAWYEKWFK